MPPKLSLADQKKALKAKDAKAKALEKAEKDKLRNERKQMEQKDKIFGLKNKNTSKHAQDFVKDVERNMKVLPGEQQKAEAKRRENEKLKLAKIQAEKELEEMMGELIKQPKVPEGVDPKTIACEFFKKGRCAKGWRCKFSHEKKSARAEAAKADLFMDLRDEETKAKDADAMEDWDQTKLESVVSEKHGGENQNNKTNITGRHFLEAVEKRLYGWFWVCPNGGDKCKYRHALPPGYVLKSQISAMLAEEKEAQRTEEEMLEEERGKMSEGTLVTEAHFAIWKKERDARRRESIEAAKEKRHAEGRLSGRELCETGVVKADGGHDEKDAMEYVKRDTSADDANEAKARAEAEKNLARMRAMFAASGGVEGGDRTEWYSHGGGDDDDDDDDDDFFVDEDDIDQDELAAMLGQVAIGGGGGGGGAAAAAMDSDAPKVISSSNRARAAAAAAARSRGVDDARTEQALSGFLSHIEGDGELSGEGAKIVGTIKHREKPPAAKKPQKSGRGDSDSEPEYEGDPELDAMLAKNVDKSAQLAERTLATGLTTKSGAKSKALLEKEKEEREREAREREKAKAAEEEDPFAVDDDDLDLEDLVAAVKR